MWGLAAAFGPIGWVVAAVGTAATVYAATNSNDEYETSTYSDKSERKSEALKATRTEKNNKIHQDIKAYKSKQIKRLKDKYDVDIKFYGGRLKSSSGISSSVTGLAGALAGVAIAKELFENDLSEKVSVSKNNEIDTISILEQETEEMIKLIGKLEIKKYETTN
jgi:Tfp pilus assembly protein PilP